MKQCSCKGNNTNCIRCGGSGTIKGSLGKNLVEKVEIPKAHAPMKPYDPVLLKTLHAPKAIKASCPYCATMVNNLSLHVSQVHCDKWDDFTSNFKSKS